MGHIKLDRKILEWEWYTDINTCRLFLHILLKANWKDGRFKGIEIPRGSFVASYQTLADESGLTVRGVRTALKHLKATGEVTVKRHAKFSVITVNNYCLYQSSDTETDNQVTVERQSSDSQATTIEEVKKLRREEEKEKTYMRAFEELWEVYPRKSEKAAAYDKYKARLSDGYSEDELATAVKRYADQCEKESTEQRYIKHAKTFFGPRMPFADFLEHQVVVVEKQEEDRFESLEDSVRADLVERGIIDGQSLRVGDATEEDIALLREKRLL